MIGQMRYPGKRHLGWSLKKRQQHSAQVLFQEHWSHTVPVRGSSEGLRLLIDCGQQTHDFLEPPWCEESLRQGIHRSPDLRVGSQCSGHRSEEHTSELQ